MLKIALAMPLCIALAAGCGKPEDTAGTPGATVAPGGPPPGAPPGGGPGMGRGPGGGGGPIAANASGKDIYQAKCAGCHGAEGKGARGPSLASASGDSDDAITKIIHDGKEKMPAFASQLSDEQIKKLVATVKTFK